MRAREPAATEDRRVVIVGEHKTISSPTAAASRPTVPVAIARKTAASNAMAEQRRNESEAHPSHSTNCGTSGF
jgi:hypothetical protein